MSQRGGKLSYSKAVGRGGQVWKPKPSVPEGKVWKAKTVPVAETKTVTPPPQSEPKARRFETHNTGERRAMLMRMYQAAVNDDVAKSGVSSMQVNYFDEKTDLALIGRFRDLADSVLPDFRGVLIHAGSGMVISKPYVRPTVLTNQSLSKAMEMAGLTGSAVKFYEGVQGVMLHFTKWDGKVVSFSNINLELSKSSQAGIRLSTMLEQSGFDPNLLFTDKPYSMFTHSFIIVHKLYARAMQTPFAKPYLIYVRTTVGPSWLQEGGLAAKLKAEGKVETTALGPSDWAKSVAKPWNEGGLYLREPMTEGQASDWLDHGVLSRYAMSDPSLASYYSSHILEGGIEGISAKLRQGEHLYVEVEGKQRPFVFTSESWEWRMGINSDINLSLSFYQAFGSRLRVQPENIISVRTLEDVDKKMPILYWPSVLVEKGGDKDYKQDPEAYTVLANMLLAAPISRHNEVFAIYHEYMQGIKNVIDWIPVFKPSDVKPENKSMEQTAAIMASLRQRYTEGEDPMDLIFELEPQKIRKLVLLEASRRGGMKKGQ